jgi:hypothetical protein
VELLKNRANVFQTLGKANKRAVSTFKCCREEKFKRGAFDCRPESSWFVVGRGKLKRKDVQGGVEVHER